MAHALARPTRTTAKMPANTDSPRATRATLCNASEPQRASLIYPFPIRLPTAELPLCQRARHNIRLSMAHYAPSFPFGHFITNRRHFSLYLFPFTSPDPFLALSLSLSLFLTVAPSPIKPSTKLPARFPEKPTTHSLSRLRINVFFFNRYLFSLPSSLSLYSSRSCAVLRQTRCVEFYCAHDCSRLNKTDRKTRSECVPHFRQSSRIFLISSRSLNIILRDVFVPFLHSVFSFFFPLSL